MCLFIIYTLYELLYYNTASSAHYMLYDKVLTANPAIHVDRDDGIYIYYVCLFNTVLYTYAQIAFCLPTVCQSAFQVYS